MKVYSPLQFLWLLIKSKALSSSLWDWILLLLISLLAVWIFDIVIQILISVTVLVLAFSVFKKALIWIMGQYSTSGRHAELYSGLYSQNSVI
ncbi:hypothetical protein HBA55_26065 [Pseudomaricurvus alkylphenolicus]|nr:hypothetical protein [Pseudomaricurvus alkylphenolicus]